MSKNDKKKQWKPAFAEICPHAARDQVFEKGPPVVVAAAKNDQPAVPAAATTYASDMRAFYKQIRSKPKGKTQRGGSRKWTVESDD